MTTIQDIANELGAPLPDAYVNCAQKGMLDWGDFGPRWFTETMPGLAQRPPLLLFTRDYEGLSSEDAAEAFEELYADDDYREVDSSRNLLLPFAQSGAGDFYCFDFSSSDARDGSVPPPVVFAWHDDDSLETLAPDFMSFVFRQLLTAALCVEGDFTYVNTGAGHRANLAALLDSHRVLLDAGFRDCLDEVFSRETRTSASGDVGYLDETEWAELVTLYVGIDPEDPPTRPYMGTP